MEHEIPFHIGDFAFFKPLMGPLNPLGNQERLVVVWQVHQDGRLELIASGSSGRERFELNYFDEWPRLRRPNETEGRLLAEAWFSRST